MDSHQQIRELSDLRHLGEHDQALKQLNAILQEQYLMFKTSAHEEIGETLHYIGDCYYAKNNYLEAITAYLKALVCKMQINYENDYTIKLTQNALTQSLDSIPHNHPTIATQLNDTICFALQSDTNIFVNKCQDFFQKIHIKSLVNDIIAQLINHGEKESWDLQFYQNEEPDNVIIYDNFNGFGSHKKVPENISINNIKEIKTLFLTAIIDALGVNSLTYDDYQKASQSLRPIIIKSLVSTFSSAYFNQLLNFDVSKNIDPDKKEIHYFLTVNLLKDVSHDEIRKIINDIAPQFVGYATRWIRQIMTVKLGLLENFSLFQNLDSDTLNVIFNKMHDRDIIPRKQLGLK